MSIATEIQRLQEAKADIKTAIEEKGVEVGNGLIDGYADKVDAVYDKGVTDGKQVGYKECWDVVQDYGNRIAYDYAFYRWSCEYIRPEYKVIPKAGQNGTYRYLQMFSYNPRLKKIEKKYFDLSQYENPNGYTSSAAGNYCIFSNCPNLEEIEDVGMKPYYYYSTFSGCSKLHTIEVVRSDENTTFDTMVFKECTALENIKIEGVIAKNISFYQSPNLSKASIESIINHLSDTTGATLTLSKTAVNREFGSDTSDEWIETIADKVSSYNGVTYNGLWEISLV